MTRALILAGVLSGLTLAASAQFRAPATGEASAFIQYGCDPCCFVTNLHQSKPIQAVLFMMMSKHETRIEPRQTARFPIRNDCAKGAMGLEVHFAG